MENASFPEERKVSMLTIQSFLHKFRNHHLSKDMKKNVKYAMLIFAYAFIAVVMVLKFNVFKLNSDKKTLEAFAAQDITRLNEETKVLSEMDYLSLALNNSSKLEQKSFNETMQGSLLNYIGTSIGALENLKDNSGHVTLMSADIYAGDLISSTDTKASKTKKTSKTAKENVASVSTKKNQESKSATKEEVAEEAKETMNTGVAVFSLSSKEIEILQRIVEAEATGEDIKGKILVANVIMNRVNDSAFPDSVEDVVFQKTGGTYQFSPISDKRYYSVTVSDETKEAVKRVLQGEDYSQGALYFSARKRASAANMKWFDTNLKWLFQYGNHEFFKNK